MPRGRTTSASGRRSCLTRRPHPPSRRAAVAAGTAAAATAAPLVNIMVFGPPATVCTAPHVHDLLEGCPWQLAHGVARFMAAWVFT